MRSLGTIRQKINGTTVNIQDIGQTQVFGYLVQFIRNNKIEGEAVIINGTSLFLELQEADFYRVADIIYNALK